MRFRKSITICKGVRVNFSKSGTSLTVGPRGASVNIGKNGTYLNTGIPGTGLYDRTKIGGGKRKTGAPSRRPAAAQNTSARSGSGRPDYSGNSCNPYTSAADGSTETFNGGDFRLDYKEDGTVDIYDANTGERILNPAILRAIRRTPEYNEGVAKLSAQRLQEENAATQEIENLYKKSCPVYPVSEYQSRLDALKPQQYQAETYPVPQPSREDITAKLRKDAEASVKTWKFWQKDQLIEEYIQEHIRQALADAVVEWKVDKDDFVRKEQERAETENANYQRAYQAQKEHFQELLENDAETIDSVLNDWIAGVEMPFAFRIDYQLEGDMLRVDLDLPEIEDMPRTYAQQLASGMVKIKDKPQKKIKSDYYDCVLGLGLCIATHFFGLAVGVQQIVMSAYTQRRDKTGRMRDDYIYSVKFNRDDLLDLDLQKPVDELFFKNENVCNVLYDKTFKTIIPF